VKAVKLVSEGAKRALLAEGAEYGIYGVYMDWNMRVVRLIIGIGLLMCLLSTSLVGCGITSPPVKSLEQWERDSNRVRSRE
jgi:hypothetical protein